MNLDPIFSDQDKRDIREQVRREKLFIASSLFLGFAYFVAGLDSGSLDTYVISAYGFIMGSLGVWKIRTDTKSTILRARLMALARQSMREVALRHDRSLQDSAKYLEKAQELHEQATIMHDRSERCLSSLDAIDLILRDRLEDDKLRQELSAEITVTMNQIMDGNFTPPAHWKREFKSQQTSSSAQSSNP